MTQTIFKYLYLVIALVGCALSVPVMADGVSARQAMEDADNPLLVINTSRGDIFIEMLRREAPSNVAHFMALANGEVAITDPVTNTSVQPRYFDGMRFHRVLPGFVIQAGSPAYHALGTAGATLSDEINADALGLDREPVLAADGTFNSKLQIANKADFAQKILDPLYRKLGIDELSDLEARQNEVATILHDMTLKDAYENQGYEYLGTVPTRGISRGILALANHGPNTNGPEFFISLQDAPWLTGKYTVIGRVVEGMEVADTIGASEIDPARFSRQSTVIYSVTTAASR